MKIALIGTHGAGKTTLAVALAERLGYPLVTEGAREVLEHYRVSENLGALPVHVRLDVQAAILEHHLLGTYRKPSFVSDRGTPDILAYSLFWMGREDECQPFLSMLREIVEDWPRFYDRVFLVDPLPSLQDDGVRCAIPAYQHTIHLLISGMDDWTRLPAEPVENRVARVLAELEF